MDPYEVIIQPIDTEKTRYQASELGQYTFQVSPSSNKIEVKRAIEAIFEVEVVAVNIINVPAKVTRRYGRRSIVRRPTWKKAMVTLAAGERLDVFEGV
jgi:large subunit ribosomal protein L23